MIDFPTPDLVQLHHQRGIDAGTGLPFLAVEVRERPSGAPAFFGTIGSVAAWLKRHGYAYVTGTNGMWAKP